MRKKNLQRLLRPRHIVFVGGNNLQRAIRSTEAIGFNGEIWVVNPKYDSIAGRRCYRSIADLPCPPDAAFVAVNSTLSVESVKELAAAGAGGVICYAAGFSETGAAGESLQQALVAAAGEMALVGPNCYGVLNYLDGAAMWPDLHGGKPVSKGAAIISQSGNIALNLTMADRSCPLSYVISVGNQAVLGVGDFIDALLEDSRVSVIGIYLEGLTDVPGFARAAARALAQGVPVVVLKAGISELGTQLTMSHTSSLAGSDEMYQALFDRLGVIRVESLTALIETLKLCAITGPAPGQNLVILTCSGGNSAISADLSEAAGLRLPPLEDWQATALRTQLPDFASISNPMDYNTAIWGKPAELERCFNTVMGSAKFDAVMLIVDFPHLGTSEPNPWLDAAQAIITACRTSGKPAVVASVFPELLPMHVRELLAANGVAPLQGIADALTALGASARYTQHRREVLSNGDVTHLALNPPVAEVAGDRVLDEWESKRTLAAFGLPIPAAHLVPAADAAQAAQALGYPVVVKISSDQVPHKTEAGAVRLNLKTADEVSAAVTAIAQNVAAIAGVGDRFLVEKMMGGAVAELIIGLKRDPQFGLALVLGSGGILVELVKDSAVLLLPTSRDEIAKALAGLRGFRLLQGFRGRPLGDVEAVIDAVMAVANYAQAHQHSLLEVDINPLLVLPAGRGAVAADALIRTGEASCAGI